MKNFENKSNRGRDKDFKERDFRRGSSEKRQFGSRNRERQQMHEVICSDCGKKCEVPFKPTGSKPVYCSQCFSKHRASSTSNSFERRGYEKSRFQDKRMFDAICNKCGKRFGLPFRPTGDKPVYCNECFDRGSRSLSKDKIVNQYKEQFEVLNTKLDRIIKALTPAVSVKKKKVIVKKKKIVVEKKKKAKKSKKAKSKKV